MTEHHDDRDPFDPYRVGDRVAAGTEWLDARRPGWDKLIDLTDFSLTSCTRCVLGQLYGHYTHAPLSDGTSFFLAAACLGFTAADDNDGGPTNEFAELTQEWRRVIVARRIAEHARADGGA